MNKLFLFAIIAFSLSLQAQTYLLPSRPSVDPALAPFYHGVASGDPLSDRVIIWTRVTTNNATANVEWQMASDTAFSSVVNSGTVTTDSSVDYTVKVDVTGLSSNHWYYYRFKADSTWSITGRTRTAPVGGSDSLRFAVVACSNFQAGYFNVYHDIANRNDIDAVLHLGDYYYEYESGGYGYINDTARLHDPGTEAMTLFDYRMRHSQYKLDADCRQCHQQYPFITIWDDHETANNSWYGGAENHTPGTEGDWFVRKDAGKKAYFEWLPIREIAPNDDTILHRTEHWGNLLDLIMIDTRYEGRDTSLGTGIAINNTLLNDTNRRILGIEQMDWFKTQLSTSTARWKVIGNQVMIAPLVALGLVLNGDQWDGYPAERKRVFDYIMQNNLHDVVFLTGDIHSSWGNDLPHPDSTYVPSTGAGSVATEFVATSITSPALQGLGTLTTGIVQLFDTHVKYVELSSRGYLLFDVNQQRVQGDWIHVNTVTSKTYNATDDAHWMNLDGERFLRQAPGPLGPRLGNPSLIPQLTGIGEIKSEEVVLLSCYPNPFENELSIQYYIFKPTTVILNITDMKGSNVYTNTFKQSMSGLYDLKENISTLAAGNYLVSLSTPTRTISKQIVKAK